MHGIRKIDGERMSVGQQIDGTRMAAGRNIDGTRMAAGRKIDAGKIGKKINQWKTAEGESMEREWQPEGKSMKGKGHGEETR